MWRVPRLLLIAAAVVVLASGVANAADKWARGTISAMGADSITLDVNGQSMVFNVTTATDVIAKGAGTRAREVKQMTGEKPKMSDVLKVGDKVEVQYTESAGAMTATVIRGGIAAGAMTSDQADKAGAKKVQGVVTAVSANSISVKGEDGAETTFMADQKIAVVGKGLGTMAKEKGVHAEKVTLTDAVAVGDTVTVTYKMMGDKKHASTVTVIKKGT